MGRKPAPATTPTRREQQLIAKAVDLAEQQIEDGTVSAQVLTHYLKMGSTREALEQQMMQERMLLMEQQRENLATAGRIESLIEDAVSHMKYYQTGDRGHVEKSQQSEELQ
jgi:hypothetical protein